MKPGVGAAPERTRLTGKKRAGRRTQPPSEADRELVLRMLRNLVACGVAEWAVLESGAVLLRLASGALFNLDRNGVTRLA